MAPRWSAGLLAYRQEAPRGLWVFIGHMGGPLWAHRDEGGWSIPKGEFDPTVEDAADAARREFAEEIGVAPPAGAMIHLGVHRQPSGKRVTTFAIRAPSSLRFAGSNEFEMEWPRNSGIVRSFPELDRAEWFPVAVAARKVLPGQVPILRALESALAQQPPGTPPGSRPDEPC